MTKKPTNDTSCESCQHICMLVYLGVKLLEFKKHKAALDK